jgi:hypothetical protein
MKSLLAAVLVSFAVPAFSDALVNDFACHTDDNSIEFNYSSSSLTGQPQLSVTIDGEQVFPPTGVQFSTVVSINAESGVLGTFVYGQDNSMTPVDAPGAIYGFYVPTINSLNGQNSVEFQSVFIRASVGGFIPAWVPVQRISDAVPMTCVGQKVVF